MREKCTWRFSKWHPGVRFYNFIVKCCESEGHLPVITTGNCEIADSQRKVLVFLYNHCNFHGVVGLEIVHHPYYIRDLSRCFTRFYAKVWLNVSAQFFYGAYKTFQTHNRIWMLQHLNLIPVLCYCVLCVTFTGVLRHLSRLAHTRKTYVLFEPITSRVYY